MNINPEAGSKILEQILAERNRRLQASTEIQKEEQRIKEAERFRAKWKAYFPDNGPFRRELYPRHIKFFEAGASYRERAAVMGNRCITPWSKLETDRGERLAYEVIAEGSFDVQSWDGGSRQTSKASPLFLRSIEPAFQIHLDNGEVFQCSYNHEVLTTSGFARISQIVRASGALHFQQTDLGCLASYVEGDHLCDELLRSSSDNGQEKLQALSCVLDTDQLRWPVDGVASIPSHNRAYLNFDHLPSRDAHDLLVDLFERNLAPFEKRPLLPSQLSNQEWLQSLCVSFQRLGGLEVELPSQDGSLLCADSSLNSWFAFIKTPILFGGRRIVAAIHIGYQPIIDLTVPGANNYFSGGLVHHNCGKSEAGCYEMVVHLTGEYPPWWKGKRFSKPVHAWACGDTNTTVRDIIQEKLLGRIKRKNSNDDDLVTGIGTGMIPGDRITGTRQRVGIPDAIEIIYVKHKSGGVSQLNLKSYEQGRKAFQGTAIEVIWLDEECPEDIYTECLLRTMTCAGILYVTFTPLSGLTQVVMKFLPAGKMPEEGSGAFDGQHFVVTASWDDVPHLSEEAKKDLLTTIPAYQRDARSKGIPQLGSGQIYPVAESEITVDPFPIPEKWRKCYGMDVGWNRTAAIWLAEDPVSKTWHAYSEHYIGREEPALQVHAIKARGELLVGAIDPAARGRSQADGAQLLQTYKELGLKLFPAKNAVESGLYDVWQAFTGGQLKIFKGLNNTLEEYRLYRRDDKGHVVKEKDHLMDALRYGWVSGRDRAVTFEPPPPPWKPRDKWGGNRAAMEHGWMAS